MDVWIEFKLESGRIIIGGFGEIYIAVNLGEINEGFI